MKWCLELEFEGDREHWELAEDGDVLALVLGPAHVASERVAEFVGGRLRAVRFGRVGDGAGSEDHATQGPEPSLRG